MEAFLTQRDVDETRKGMRKMRETAFTLVELLVVIAILVLLVGLVMPALRAARERARMVMCINNLHQLGRAIHVYARDFDGWLPGWWHSFTAEGNQTGDPATGSVYPYHKEKKLNWCLNDKRGYGKRPYAVTWAGMCQIWDGSRWWGNAGLNSSGGVKGGRGQRLDRFKHTSEALMLVEENSDNSLSPVINDAICCNFDFTDNRHMGDRAVVTYIDGHTATLGAGIQYNANSGEDEVFGIQ